MDSGWIFSKSRQGHMSDTAQGTCRQQRAWLIGRSTLPRGLLCLERHRVWLGDGKVWTKRMGLKERKRGRERLGMAVHL